MIDTVPPDGHIADARISLREDGGFELVVGTAEFGNGTSTVHRQIAASALATTVDRIRLKQSDTAHGGHDTGAYGSTGTFVAGNATRGGGAQSRQISQGLCRRRPAAIRITARWTNDAVVLRSAAHAVRRDRQSRSTRRDDRLTASGTSAGTPRSVAFNVQGFRVAVNKATGEIRILKSVQAADAGRVANPMQLRGQVEGGVAQSLGAALYEEMVIDGARPRRQSEIPRLPSAVIRRRAAHRRLFRAKPADALGPMGAKSMSESPYNPVAPALGNALADATGIRFTTLPFKPDRLFPLLQEKFGG